VLALDFDGVLSPHGAEQPLPEVTDWLKGWVAAIGRENIFILSNRPTQKRIEWFGEQFPGVRFISGVRKKPFPDGLQRISELSGCSGNGMLMADDRLLTGCLAAMLAGATPYYIRNPYRNFRLHTVKELFFQFIRISERILIQLTA
jgi:predicted HAD superfamily phosphohydrolase YqeG